MIEAGVQTGLPDYQSDDLYTSEVNDLPVDITKGEVPRFDASGRIRNVRSFSRTPLVSEIFLVQCTCVHVHVYMCCHYKCITVINVPYTCVVV